jgi:hypothetical protein
MRLTAILLLLGNLAAGLPALAQAPGTPGTPRTQPADPSSAPGAEAPAAPVASASLVNGLWCGSGPLHEFSLRLTQRQQDVEGELVRRGKGRTIEGRIDGNVLRTQATKVGALVLEHKGDELMVTGGDGPIALARGQVFRRTDADTCSG